MEGEVGGALEEGAWERTWGEAEQHHQGFPGLGNALVPMGLPHSGAGLSLADLFPLPGG